MRPAQIVGVLLIIGGLAALLMGGFSFTRSEEVLDIGPVEAQVERRETIPLSPIVGIAALAGGIALVVAGARTRSRV